jgi:hypothetical protein
MTSQYDTRWRHGCRLFGRNTRMYSCQTKGFCYFCPVKSKEYMFLHLRYPSKKEKFFCTYNKIHPCGFRIYSEVLTFKKGGLQDKLHLNHFHAINTCHSHQVLITTT